MKLLLALASLFAADAHDMTPMVKTDVICEPGVCFDAVASEECPRMEYLGLKYLFEVHHHCTHQVPHGDLCEGDGYCGTDNYLNNCGFVLFHGYSIPLDVYRRVECCPEVTTTRTSECRLTSGSVSREESTFEDEELGNDAKLTNLPGAELNTRVNAETDEQKVQRLEGFIPEGESTPEYDPVCDAKCFTDDVYEPCVGNTTELYHDYVKVIERGFEFPSSVSEENNGVTNDRIAGMMIRMCFHDNTAMLGPNPNPLMGELRPPPQHVHNMLEDTGGGMKWKGCSRYMDTSGADASVLLCPEERYHPNNNYDQTASRVLDAFQKKHLSGGTSSGTSLKEKYDLSYSDLLNNGCIAAVVWAATNADESLKPEALLKKNPFMFGRHDACRTRNNTRYPLCGHPEILPGVQQDIHTIDSWYAERGFNPYLWLIQFFTHTMMDNMADNCPLKNLTCEATEELADAVNYIEDYEVGKNLDYFNFFIARGHHQPYTPDEIEDEEGSNCHWTVNGEDKEWPMTQADCTISLDQAVDEGKYEMEAAIRYFHMVSTKEKILVLLCSLRIMASDGSYPGGACDHIANPDLIISGAEHHFFGGHFPGGMQE